MIYIHIYIYISVYIYIYIHIYIYISYIIIHYHTNCLPSYVSSSRSHSSTDLRDPIERDPQTRWKVVVDDKYNFVQVIHHFQ